MKCRLVGWRQEALSGDGHRWSKPGIRLGQKDGRMGQESMPYPAAAVATGQGLPQRCHPICKEERSVHGQVEDDHQ